MKPSTINEVKLNRKYDTLYIDTAETSEYHIRFNLVNTFKTKRVKELLSEGAIKKILSLNTIGYYLFIIKLTIHFMRAEGEEVVSLR